MAYAKSRNAKSVIAEYFSPGTDIEKIAKDIELYAQEKVVFNLEVLAKKQCPRCKDGKKRVSRPDVNSETLSWHENGMDIDIGRLYYTPCHGFPFWKELERERISLMLNKDIK